MKKIINYLLIASLAVAALACQDLKKEPGTGKAEPAMKGVFYADIPGEKTPVEIAPGASKTYSLKACAFRSNVTDIVMNFSFKVNEEAVSAYNEANGTSYVMCPGSAFEFLTNEVMLPRYGKASTTARLKVTASGLEKDVTYMLPVTLDKARQTESWSLADTLAAYVLLTLSDFDPNGPGTENNPYPITTVEELRNMGDLLEEGMKTYFRLDADLDMAGVMDWEPINTGSPFKPIYLDGDMHTISNFSGKTSLFGGVAGSISNLIITGANIENAAGPVGIRLRLSMSMCRARLPTRLPMAPAACSAAFPRLPSTPVRPTWKLTPTSTTPAASTAMTIRPWAKGAWSPTAGLPETLPVTAW